MVGSKYLVMNLDWDYDNKTVDYSMLGYMMHQFQHVLTKAQKSPYQAPWINYGQKEKIVQNN